MTIDEVQRDPGLILAIKTVVDEQRPRRPGQFVLTGPANLLLHQRVADSLAGRAYYTRLWPLTRRELLGLGTTGTWTELFAHSFADWRDLVRADAAPAESWRDAARRGGFPEAAHELAEDDEARSLWFRGYVSTYLEHDLRDLRAVQDVSDVQRLMRARALRIGNLLNQTELSRETGIPATTVHDYLNLLETSYQLVRLPAFSINRTKRLIKAPKLYWNDAALALTLSGGEPTGAHLENLVLSDLLAWRDVQVTPPEILYWRTASGQEVDFVIEWQGELLPVEINATTTPGVGDRNALRAFCQEYPDLVRGGLLLHGGTETVLLGERILATPWWTVI